MLEKRSRPIHKLLEPINSGNRTGFSGEIPVLSPTGPLDLKIWSPTGWKNQQSEGVGLGIVAALEKSCGEFTGRIMMGHLNGSNPNASGSNPIPIEMENFNRYTSLISNEPKSIFTTDYYDGDKNRRPYPKKDKNRGDSHKRWRNLGQSCTSQPDFREEIPPMADFLKSCYLCLRKLHGKDIYMYRGEKAFCSPECRYQQIATDEHKEKCRSEASKPSNISASASPYSGNRLFFTGIVVA